MSKIVYMKKRQLANHIVPGIAARLRRERERLGVSQEEFARRIGITRATQNYYENAAREPGLSYLSSFGQNGGDLQYLLFADEDGHEYIDLIDWELLGKVWDWVHKVAVDSKGNPYPPDLQKKAFRLAYQACRQANYQEPAEIDLAILLGAAA